MSVEHEVVRYLRERGLISPGEAATPEVIDVSRRNRNVGVFTGPDFGFFVKQGVGPARAASVANEANVYGRLAGPDGSKGLNRYLPQYFGYDPLRHLLVLGLVPGSVSLRDYHATRGHFSITVARALGDALGCLHDVSHPDQKGADPHVTGAPWVLSLHRPDLELLQSLTGATIELIKTLQQIPELCDQLDSLRLEWEAGALIHNDVRWDNCLVFAAPKASRTTRLKLVDWELSGVGDPSWDVGCAFSDYLAFWLTSIPITGDALPDRYIHLARHPIERMHPAILSLWRSYLFRMGVSPGRSVDLLHRAVRYGAARLVQRAFERTQNATWVTSDVICLLQLSLNILQSPIDAAATLLGLPVDDWVQQ